MPEAQTPEQVLQARYDALKLKFGGDKIAAIGATAQGITVFTVDQTKATGTLDELEAQVV